MRTIFFLSLLWIGCLSVAGLISQAQAQGDPVGNADMSSAIKTFAGMSPGDKDMIMASAGLPSMGNFNMASVIANLLFGSIGFIAFVYGKKNAFLRPMIIGIGLMVYPWMVTNSWALFGIGIVLTAALYYWRD